MNEFIRVHFKENHEQILSILSNTTSINKELFPARRTRDNRMTSMNTHICLSRDPVAHISLPHLFHEIPL